MTDPIQPSTLVPALKAVMQWLTAEHIAGRIIGGVAASVRGRPRYTKDIDADQREAAIKRLASSSSMVDLRARIAREE